MQKTPSSPKSRSPIRIVLIAAGVVFAVAFAIGAFFIINKVSEDNYIKKNGVTAVGTPTGNVIDTSTKRGRYSDADWRVEYEFFVNDKRYTALGENSENVRDLAQKRANYIGTIDIIYLPEDPSRYYAYDFRHIF